LLANRALIQDMSGALLSHNHRLG